MKLGNAFPKNRRREYVDSKIQKGLVVCIPVKFTTPPKTKYLILIGQSHQKDQAKVLVINSEINQFIKNKPLLFQHQVKISQSNCSFLTGGESYIDCIQIKTLKLSEFKEILIEGSWQIVGNIDQTTLSKVENIILNSRLINQEDKNIIKSW